MDVTVVIAGPTAAGKSALAVALARRYQATGLAAEIINADAMLVYRGMDIGTAKPTAAERGGVTHHLIDILDVRETATVADFQQLARAQVDACRAQDVVPILVGGSALYLRAILDDFQFPGTDPAVRAELEAELAHIGSAALHGRLAGIDPEAAARMEPNNGRRVVRALEVIRLTGAPYHAALPAWEYLLPDVVQVGLRLDRPTLDARIALRVDQMWAAGFVDEVRRLSEHGLREGVTASRALGYRQILRFLDGDLEESQAREQTVFGTRRFARRQDSWFRRDHRVHWLDHADPRLVDRAYAIAGPPGDGRTSPR